MLPQFPFIPLASLNDIKNVVVENALPPREKCFKDSTNFRKNSWFFFFFFFQITVIKELSVIDYPFFWVVIYFIYLTYNVLFVFRGTDL